MRPLIESRQTSQAQDDAGFLPAQMSEVEKRLAIVRRITTVMGDDIDFRNESHV